MTGSNRSKIVIVVVLLVAAAAISAWALGLFSGGAAALEVETVAHPRGGPIPPSR
jgi:hypothetical protein